MAGRPYVLAEVAWKNVEITSYEVAVLPWGATEAHNYHLPYGTDTLESEAVAAEACRLAWSRGARVIMLPAVPYGVQSGQLDIPLCLHMSSASQAALLNDLANSLERHGIRKLVILNGHGGNDFRPMVRELQAKVDMFICTLNWYSCVDPGAYFDQPGDHAGELETSVMLHLAPELTLSLEEAGDGSERKYQIDALREGWAWAPRRWTQVSKDTGVGDPRGASADKGEKFFGAVADRIAGFLRDLSAADPDQMYER
ncbi:creatininase family protein [soil metagenome]